MSSIEKQQRLQMQKIEHEEEIMQQSILKLPSLQQNIYQLTQSQIQLRYCLHFLNAFKELNFKSTKNFLLNSEYLDKVQYNLYSKMMLANFTFIKQPFHSTNCDIQIQIQICQKSQYYNVLQLYIIYHNIRKTYKVLNQLQESHRHQNTLVGFGSFSNVYNCQSFQNYPIVVKCLKYEDSCLEDLKNHIKQFFIYDIMSTLAIGPKIVKDHSFDFILFKDCIQFHMEKCYPINTQTLEKDIKNNLLNMHYLCFVHNDIKPANIMYSKNFNKNVLIDFGITEKILVRRGQKALSGFKGTYEFCGEQMKSIFLKKSSMLIDLYYNDIQMFLKSLQCILNRQTNEKDEKFDIKRKQYEHNQSQIISKNQMSLMFKYFIYENKNKNENRNFKIYNQFTQKFQKNVKQRIKQDVIKQGIQFVNTFQDSNQIRFIYIKFLNNLIAKYLRDGLKKDDEDEQTFFLQNNQNQQLNYSNVSKIKFQKIYRFLQQSSKPFEVSQIDKKQLTLSLKLRFNRLSLEETENILFSLPQMQTLQIDSILTIFLLYATFWKSQFTIDIDKKQLAASFVAKVLTQRNATENVTLLDEAYSPQIQFVRNQCPNLLLVFRFLLSYCMSGEFSIFKEQFMGEILKNSVILNFKYITWITKYMVIYLKGLVSHKYKKIATRIVIEFHEINFLTSKNFYCTSSLNTLLELEIKRFDYEKILQQVIQMIQELNKSKVQKENDKRVCLQLIKTAIRNYQKWNENNVQNTQFQGSFLFSQQNIQELKKITKDQISLFRLKILLTQQNDSDGVRIKQDEFKLGIFYLFQLNRFNFRFNNLIYIDFFDQSSPFIQKNINYIKELIGFDIRMLNTKNQTDNPNDDINSYKKQLAQFDKKINCRYLSETFHLIERCQSHNSQRNKDQIIKMLQLIINYEQYSYLNYEIILSVHLHIFLQQNLKSLLNQDQSSYNELVAALNKIHCIYDKIILFLKHDQLKLNEALKILINKSYSQQFQYKNVFYSDSRYNFYLTLFQESSFISSKTYLVIILISHFQKLYSLNFLRARKLMLTFFQYVLINFNNETDKNTVDKDLISQIQVFLVYWLFKTQMLSQQISLWWTNHKIQTLITKPSNLIIQKDVILTLAITKKTKQLSEIFCILLLKMQNYQQNIIQFQMYQKWFRQVTQYSYVRNQFYSDFLICFQQAKKVIISPLKLLPIYFCLLNFHDILKFNKKFLKKIVSQMCIVFDQSLWKYMINPKIIGFYRNLVYMMSIRYWKLMNPQKEKIKRIMMNSNEFRYQKTKLDLKIQKLIKNHCKYSDQDPAQKEKLFKFYQKRLKMKFQKLITNYKKRQIKYQKIQQKLKQIMKNCQIQEKYSIQNSPFQQQQYYFKQGHSAQYCTESNKVQAEQDQTIIYQIDGTLRVYQRRFKFKNQYGIRDLALFSYHGILYQHFLLIQYKERDPQKQKIKKDELNEAVMQLKETQDFYLAQDSIQLFRRILQTRGKYLRQQFLKTDIVKDIDPDNIPINILFSKFSQYTFDFSVMKKQYRYDQLVT